MLELKINVTKSAACKITVYDNTGFYTNEDGFFPQSMTGFLDETRSGGGKGMFRLSDVDLYTVLYYNGTKPEDKYVDKSCTEHYADCSPYTKNYNKLIDCQNFVLDRDGWYSIFYISLPCEKWFNYELERYNNGQSSRLNYYSQKYENPIENKYVFYSGVYYSRYNKINQIFEIVYWTQIPVFDEITGLFIKWTDKQEIISLKQLVNLDTIEDTTIIQDRREVVSLCNLEMCWMSSAKKLLASPNPCASPYDETAQDRYRRDFLKMSLDVISFQMDLVLLEGLSNFSSVQLMIENINYCGLCTNKDIPSYKRCNCKPQVIV